MATLTNVCILKYNNYYNRQIYHPTFTEDDDGNSYNLLEDYEDLAVGYFREFTNVNFYKSDGVEAEIVLNVIESGEPQISIGYDYLVEYRTSDERVLTRWFIIEAKQIRSGQFQLQLRRDLIIDNYDSVLDANCYIEKATVPSIEDVAIYNQEEISFNQIKQSETLLKDSSGIPWIVGYMGEDTPATQVSIEPVEYNPTTVTSLTDWEYYQYINTSFRVLIDYNVTSYFEMMYGDSFDERRAVSLTDSYYTGPSTVDARLGGALAAKKKVLKSFEEMRSIIKSHKYDLQSMLISSLSLNLYNTISTLANSYIYTSDTQKTYKVTVIDEGEVDSNGLFSRGSSEEEQVNGYFSDVAKYHYPIGVGGNSVRYDITTHNYKVSVAEVSTSAISFTVPSTARKLDDAPYKMFCIPAGKINDNTAQRSTVDFKDAFSIAARTATTLSTHLYDIQLLPYCPVPQFIEVINNTPGLEYSRATENTDYVLLKAGTTYKTIMFFCSSSTFEININKSISRPTTVENSKIANQCDMYRLCSPNYAAQFEFNIIKTKSINKFNVDLTYKPYNPYIHIVPVWDSTSLYGQDFNDARGLICQGDFSIPVINDQWKTYQINNKNYLNAFNREVDSIELNNKYAKIQDTVNAVTGTLQGATLGGAVGTQWGGLNKAAIGAGSGAILSSIGGIADVSINNKLRKEALDLKIDQFNYSLQNIKALPNTLAKVSSFDANNKIFPLLEYYSCTEQEKTIFKDKMTYNGMTIMRIGKISDFIKSTEQFIKAKLIRMDAYDDYHTFNEIANELNEGIYIKE